MTEMKRASAWDDLIDSCSEARYGYKSLRRMSEDERLGMENRSSDAWKEKMAKLMSEVSKASDEISETLEKSRSQPSEQNFWREQRHEKIKKRSSISNDIRGVIRDGAFLLSPNTFVNALDSEMVVYMGRQMTADIVASSLRELSKSDWSKELRVEALENAFKVLSSRLELTLALREEDEISSGGVSEWDRGENSLLEAGLFMLTGKGSGARKEHSELCSRTLSLFKPTGGRTWGYLGGEAASFLRHSFMSLSKTSEEALSGFPADFWSGFIKASGGASKNGDKVFSIMMEACKAKTLTSEEELRMVKAVWLSCNKKAILRMEAELPGISGRRLADALNVRSYDGIGDWRSFEWELGKNSTKWLDRSFRRFGAGKEADKNDLTAWVRKSEPDVVATALLSFLAEEEAKLLRASAGLAKDAKKASRRKM